MRRLASALTVSLILAFVLGTHACGGNGESGTASRWIDLLGQIPDTTETRHYVVMNDYARVREAFDIKLPKQDASETKLLAYLQQVMREEAEPYPRLRLFPAPIFATGPVPSPPLDGMMEDLGFTIASVDQDVRAGAEPVVFQVLRGRFDEEAVDRAVRNDPAFSDILEEASHLGVDYYVWGEDFAGDPEDASAGRPPGVGHRLAIHGEYVYWAASIDGLEAIIEAGAGQKPSLADDEAYRLLAEGLESLQTYTALFTDDTDRLSLSTVARMKVGLGAPPDAVETVREQLEAQPHLLRYQAYATGAGVDLEGEYAAVALVHDDAETAERNAQRLADRINQATDPNSPEPLSELFDAFEISTDGPLVLAKLYTSREIFWLRLLSEPNSLLLHE